MGKIILLCFYHSWVLCCGSVLMRVKHLSPLKVQRYGAKRSKMVEPSITWHICTVTVLNLCMLTTSLIKNRTQWWTEAKDPSFTNNLLRKALRGIRQWRFVLGRCSSAVESAECSEFTCGAVCCRSAHTYHRFPSQHHLGFPNVRSPPLWIVLSLREELDLTAAHCGGREQMNGAFSS